MTGTDIIITDHSGFVTTITPTHQANLRVLAAYLMTLPPEYPDFAMNLFTTDDEGHGWHVAHKSDCGTAACAVGHGPNAGVVPIEDETWSSYSVRCFVHRGFLGACDSLAEPWSWCFGADWADIDNSAHGAAMRINWLLEHRSIPDDAYDQRHGFKPIGYRGDVEAAFA